MSQVLHEFQLKKVTSLLERRSAFFCERDIHEEIQQIKKNKQINK